MKKDIGQNLNNVFNGKIDSWAYLGICVCGRKKMIITPSVNLVENIGFGKKQLTQMANQNFSYKVSKLPEPYDLPQDFKINKAADNFVLIIILEEKIIYGPTDCCI